MKIIDNKDGVASGKIYNIGNPVNNYSIRDLADMMLKLANEYPEYARLGEEGADRSKPRRRAYYGKGYQDVQNRVPKITNTCEELELEADHLRWPTPCASFSTPTAARSPKRER